MGTSTPEQFAAKLGAVAVAVRTQQTRALAARALVTKRTLLVAAATRTRHVRPSWVQYRMVGDIAVVRLRGGLGHLIELGSYKKPEGWEETAKTVTARRRRNAARKGTSINESGLMRTPYGPRPYVHHPPVAAKPFWRAGVVASREPGKKAYQQVVNTTITAALR